jgi:hypothetical protein
MNLRRTAGVALVTLFIFLPFATQTAWAQDEEEEPSIRVIDVEPVPNEFVSDRDIDNFDDNGNLGAGIILETDLTGIVLVANNGFVRNPVQEGNTYRMLVSEDERVLTVSADGFFPYEIVLNDEGVRLESGKFWRIRITGDRAVTQLPVIISISEADVDLRIDGELVNYVPNSPIQLAEGEHVFQIQKQGYNPIVDSVTVDANNVLFQYTLEETDFVNVSFILNTDGAIVSIDDIPLEGQTARGTPFPAVLYPGPHELRIVAPGFVPYESRINVVDGQVNEFEINLEKNTGYLLVNSSTPNPILLIDNQPYDVNQLIEIAPRPTPYVLELSSTGYDDFRDRINITRGDTITINKDLDQQFAQLVLRVIPNTASVRVRNQSMNYDTTVVGTRSLRNLPVGNYTITASQTNFREETEELTLNKDDRETLTFNLTQIEGVGSLTLRSLDGSTVTIRGRQNLTFRNFPAEVETLPFGYYRVKATRKGFKKVNQQIEFRSAEQTIDLIQYFEPKTKGGAFTRSLLFPGAGHWYLNRSRGTLYFLGEAALIGLAVVSYGELSTAADDLRIAKDNYATATSNFDQLFQERQTALQAQRDAEEQLTLMLTGLAVLKGLELFDILVFTKNPKREYKRLQAQAGAGSLSMRYNF